MKVLQINIFGNLSTGRIAVDLYRTIDLYGYEGKVAFARNTIVEDVPYIKIGSILNVYADGIMTRITDKAGFYSKLVTKKFIKDIVEYDPDIIHLHNLHGYYINVRLLFEYLKICGKPVVWTLHDCWPFTGHCCYYSRIECYKWKSECCACPQSKAYPTSYVDNSRWNYQHKKILFTSVSNITLVAVSKWLAYEVEQSFLKDLPLEVIYNGIDTDAFKPTDNKFKKRYGLEDKFMILGVASTWDTRKGLEDFVKLAKMLDDNYRIVLIGITNREKKTLPGNILCIQRTDSVEELAGIYTEADVFFNASDEETFGLPTIEAMACGTPVIVYNTTALPEIVNDECGFTVKRHDLLEVVRKINVIRKNSPFDKFRLVKMAAVNNKNAQYLKYIELYERIAKRI